jgi:hypothetical protein
MPGTYYDHFDSYGERPEFYNLIRPSGKLVEFYDIMLQTSTSALCGEFCVRFIYHRAVGFSKYKEIFTNYLETHPGSLAGCESIL